MKKGPDEEGQRERERERERATQRDRERERERLISTIALGGRRLFINLRPQTNLLTSAGPSVNLLRTRD